MNSKIYPVMITTAAALEQALDQKISALYIHQNLYAQMHHDIRSLMKRHGYSYNGIIGKHGTLFLKNAVSNSFDPECDAIHDPLGIL